MKKIVMDMRKLMLMGLGLFLFTNGRTQSSAQTLDIVSWNITWFGSTAQYPPDDNLQEANARKVVKYLNADLYGLTEIVDTSRLRKLADSLGSNFGYVVSPFCSGNTTGIGNSWLQGQKLAFIFNKNIFTNVKARGLMRNSAQAYYNYASGRFPFMLTADVTLNGSTKKMNFILIHGKAGSSISDYERRRDATKELKDSLDAYFSNTSNIILGDFNDALNTTICTGCGTSVSSYDALIKDSTDADHYVSVTLPLGKAGQTSMTDYPNVVDNHVISNEVAPGYVMNSASVRTDVVPLVVQYAATTSDHYPVFSQYNLNGILTGIISPGMTEIKFNIFPNPFTDQIIFVPAKNLNGVKIRVEDIMGRRLLIKEEKGSLPTRNSN
jgi:endonuclease/exonuclease/phosphatase family metal-dependent hydrolase